MNVFEISPLRDRRWRGFVEQHPRASVFHRSEWLAALNQTYGYEPVAVTSDPPDKPLTNSIVFCGVKSLLTGRRFASLPFSDHCQPLVDDAGQFQLLVAYMQRKIARKGRGYFEIRPLFDIPASNAALSVSAKYVHHRLDLRGSEKSLFEGFHKDCVQRKIRRAERESLEYREGNSEFLLQCFYRLLLLTRRRHFLPPQPLKWFRALVSMFGDDLKIRVAFKSDLPVASILTLSHKRGMTYKYGCSDAKFNSLGGTAMLFWRAIRGAKTSGFEVLDMGRSDVGAAGLIAFKEHWGAQSSDVTYWRYPAAPRHTSRVWTMRIMKKLVPIMPDKLLMTSGKLLYPHIG